MNAFIRILLATGVLAGIVVFGFTQFVRWEHERAQEELETLNRAMEARLAEHRAREQRLTRTSRVAHLRIGAQTFDETGQVLATPLEFIELDADGAELATQSFEVPGNVVYVDAWTVKFDPDDVASGHPLRGHTLLLLRRIFSEHLAPIDGFPIDTPGAVPPAYATSDRSHYEKKVWEHFWAIAGDAELADEIGARIVQGEAAYLPVRSGDVLELTVDAAGGINLSRHLRLASGTDAASAKP